jgi:hypothetical protein
MGAEAGCGIGVLFLLILIVASMLASMCFLGGVLPIQWIWQAFF